MWIYIVQGIGYGLAAAAQPGPFQTYLISHSLLKGWKRSLPTAFAPLVSDGPIIALCILVLSQVPPWLERLLYIAGGLFLLYLACNTYIAWRNFDLAISYTETGTPQTLLKAALINALSPGPYIFWSLVTGPILLTAWREAPIRGFGFMASFYMTMISSLMTVIFIFSTARQFGPRVNRALLGISAFALFCFGLYQLWLGITNT